MGNLVFQATLGGQVNLVGPNTASTYNINVPTVNGNMVTTGDTGTVTNTMCATSVYTAPGTIGSGTPNTGAFTTLSASSTLSVTGAGTIQGLTVGRGAGAVSTNTAVGASALAANTSGSQNTALGYQSLQANTTASNNTSVGYQAGFSSTTATNNVFIGRVTGYTNTTGSANTFVGTATAYYNTTGSQSVSLGSDAYQNNTTGSFNTAIGQASLFSNTTASNNTAVGYQARYAGTTGANNTALGRSAMESATTGSGNTFIGYVAGSQVTTGSNNTILGSYNGNQGGLDIRTANNYIVLSDGDGNWRLLFNPDGSMRCPGVYANAAAASNAVNVDASGNVYRSTSALKYKTNVRDLENIDINLFRPVRYNSKCAIDNPEQDHFGLIADEVHAAGITELVNYGADGEVEGFQYERLTVVLLKKLQTLDAEFKAYVAAQP